MFFGDPERRRREKQQHDLDADYYKRQKAYKDAKEKQRLENARKAGIADANKLANKQPLYKKLANIGGAIAKDLATGSPNQMFGGFQQPTQKRKVKRRRKPEPKRRTRRRKPREPYNPYPLL